MLFLLLFGAFCSVLEYGRVLHLRPQPHHIWRQTIALSITRNYHDLHTGFLDTQVSNLYLDKGWSGKAAAEFPLLYYGVAKLWGLTGRSEFAYRVVMLVLHFLGAWALFALLHALFRHTLLAAALALLYLSSPALAYFALAFMTEVPALDLVLLGCLALARHRRTGMSAWLVTSALLFALAGLLKVTALMVPLALMCVQVAELVFPGRAARNGRVFERHGPLMLLLYAGVCLLVWAWYAYTMRYNKLHEGSFSNQEAQPPWRMPHWEVERAWDFATTLLPSMVHHWTVWVLMLGALAFLVLHHRRVPPGVLVLNMVLLSGTVLYTVLFFPALNEHDYYFILPLVMPWSMITCALWVFHRHRPGVLTHRWTLAALCGLSILNIAYAREDHLMRTRGQDHVRSAGTFPLHDKEDLDFWQEKQYWSRAGLLGIEPVARRSGITLHDTIICVPDVSVCAALYLAGQRGWQNFGTERLLEDSASLALYRARGARYLYVLEPEWLDRPYMKAFTQHPVLEHEGVRIYDLRP